MRADRREFLKKTAWLTAAGTGMLGARAAAASGEGGHGAGPADPMGVLVDLTACIGCRLCEYGCKSANGFDPGPLEAYDDPSVFKEQRRPRTDCYTVVNAYPNPRNPGPRNSDKPVYVKVNCLHCNHAACVSACIVGALRKQENGAVTYEAWKCIGCRYCMVACPFQIPAYEYDNAWTPEVRKCQFCFEKTKIGEKPGCVAKCPRDALTYAKRSELLTLAHQRIAAHPDRYLERVYGEHEVGGTSWLYLSSVPFEQVGFVKVGSAAPPVLTEAIQHGVFKHGLPPLALYGTLGALMFLTRRREQGHAAVAAAEPAEAEAVAAREPALALAGGGVEVAAEGATVCPASAPANRASPPSDVPDTVCRDPRSVAVKPWHPVSESHPRGGPPGHHDEAPQPARRTLFTPGVFALLALVLTGLGFGVYRFLFGLAASTNLDQQHPWGLWIAIDVASGVALAAGGFTSAFLAHVLHRERYHAIARPALLTAMLGYTFVALGLQADLGRYYNVWHPMVMWQGNSVLFEVGMCVMCYLNVLYLEFGPIACERVMAEERRFPRLARWARRAHGQLERIMVLLVIAGCVLSCLHQSSLGNLLVIAPSKLHPLWWTPWSPLLFLLSAVAVGFPMVIWEGLLASWALRLKPEMSVLGPLARFVPWTLGVYLAVKLADMAHRGTYVYLGDGSLPSTCWLLEIGGGVVLPLVLLLLPRVRQSPRGLFAAASLVVAGVLFNRINVFLIGYRPPYARKAYFPSWSECAVTLGLIAALMLVYRVIVTLLPVISQPKAEATS